jgi:hypothetical protein
MTSVRMLAWTVVLGALLAAMPAAADPITMPYTNDFSSSVADFHAAGGTWTLNTTTGLYTNTITSINTAGTALLQVTNLGGSSQQDFTLSTKFIVNSSGGANTTVGMAALGSTNTGGTFYLADVQLGGNLRLYRIDPNDSLSESSHGFTFAADVPWWLILEGTYAPGGDLTLKLTLTDGDTQTKAIDATIASANVLDGQYFGLRNRTGGAGSTLNVSFDELTIVPEPASLSLLAAGVGLLLLFGRRRRS